MDLLKRLLSKKKSFGENQLKGDGSKTAEEFYREGVRLSDLGQHEEALGCYDTALKMDPGHIKSWNNKAVYLADLGRYEEALTNVDKALEIDSAYTLALSNKGVILARLGRNREAIDYFDTVLGLELGNAAIWNEKGRSLAALDQDEDAMTCYDKSLQINQDYTPSLFNKGLILVKLGQHEKATNCYAKVVAVEPENADAWYQKALSEDALERRDNEAYSFSRFAEIAPPEYQSEVESVRRWLCEHFIRKGLEYGNSQHDDMALQSFDRALDIVQEQQETLNRSRLVFLWANRANALRRLSRLQESLESSESALEIDNSLPLGWYERGRTMLTLGKYDEASVCADRALDLAKNDEDKRCATNLKEVATYKSSGTTLEKRVPACPQCGSKLVLRDNPAFWDPLNNIEGADMQLLLCTGCARSYSVAG